MQSIEVELKQAIQNAVKKAFDLDLDVQNIWLKHQKIKITVISQVMLRCN